MNSEAKLALLLKSGSEAKIASLENYWNRMMKIVETDYYKISQLTFYTY